MGTGVRSRRLGNRRYDRRSLGWFGGGGGGGGDCGGG